MLTGALLDVAALLERVAAQLAMEVVLPEFGKPYVAPVVVQRAAGEVAVEAWQRTGMSGSRTTPSPQAPRWRDGRAHPLIQGPAGKNKAWSIHFIQMKGTGLNPGGTCVIYNLCLYGKEVHQ
jgi:hypothetical protein